MLKFIFACMAVVALSIGSIMGRPLIDGISEAHDEIALRNSESPLADDVAVRTAVSGSAPAFSPESLNDIETAAGDGAFGDEADTGTFGAAFTGRAPAALDDDSTTQQP